MSEQALQLRWYLVRAQTSREVQAAFQLERQGFETYLPKTLKTIRHARRLKTQMVAFFPGYLFVRLDITRQRWRSVNGTRGVVHLVMAGETPAPAPVGVVEDLILASDALGLHAPPQPQPGQTVRILGGPFSGQVAEVLRLDGPGRVRLLLELMGGRVDVEVENTPMVVV